MPDLKLAENLDSEEPRDMVAERFHRLNRVIPNDQEVYYVSPEAKVKEVFMEMEARSYSQVPVVSSGDVVGIFSYRSFSKNLVQIGKTKLSPDEFEVGDFLEYPYRARVNDEFLSILHYLDRDGVVLTGDPKGVLGIVTATDVLRYLFEIARPFVLLAEIEVCIRDLIRMCISQERIEEISISLLSSKYTPSPVPSKLEEMVFGDYVTVITSRRTWEDFKVVFGGAREIVLARLEQIRETRNEVFHFRKELSIRDHEILANNRDWLLSRAKIADATVDNRD